MPGSSRRDDLLEGACDYVLEHSLAAVSLRPLAAALDTSDRMLIYHFGSRDKLLTAVLDTLGARLRMVLAASLPDEAVPARHDPRDVLVLLVSAMRSPAAEPIIRVWLEMCGLAARGEQPYADQAGRVAQSWIAWLAPRLRTGGRDPEAVAAAVLAGADGLVLFGLVTGQDVSRAADVLALDLGS